MCSSEFQVKKTPSKQKKSDSWFQVEIPVLTSRCQDRSVYERYTVNDYSVSIYILLLSL